MQNLKGDKVEYSGELIAKYYKYYQQFHNSKIQNKLPLTKIHAKGFYNLNVVKFDKAARIFSKYNIDVAKFFKFFVLDFDKSSKTIDDLFNIQTYKSYVDNLNASIKYRKIYDNFIKSVNNIVNDCKQLEIYSTKDYLKYLILENKVCNYYVSGKISIYWYAAIPKFTKIIERLDDISKKEMNILYERYDIYNAQINEAFLRIRNIKVNPLRFTDDKIFENNFNDKK